MQPRNVTRTQAQAPRGGQQVPVNWTVPTEFKVPVPKDEKERVADLYRYEVLDTLPEEEFDALTALAAHICGAPIALISLVDSNRQWFKSKIGVSLSETSRDVSFCAYAIMQPDLLIVPDATKDKRFAQNPLVISDPKIRFYAGAPLISPEHHALGTLCVLDRVPRVLTREQTDALRALGRQVMAHLVMRRKLVELRTSLLEERRVEKNLQKARQSAETSVQIKTELLLRLGQQIRSTLRGISALTDEVLATGLTPKQREALHTLNAQADSLLSLTNQVLEFASVRVSRR